jgi:hypothetical protein
MRGVSCSKGQSHSCRNLRLETTRAPVDETICLFTNSFGHSYPRTETILPEPLRRPVGELLRTVKMSSLMASPLHFPRWGFLSTPEGYA